MIKYVSNWIEKGVNKDETHNIVCSNCGHGYKSNGHANSWYTRNTYRFCPYCGKKMFTEREVDE